MAEQFEIKFSNDQRGAVASIAREYYRLLVLEVARHSNTIASTLTVSRQAYKLANGSWAMRIASPYFWAGILDLGRRSVQSRSRLLVWFENPKDDPRLVEGYPKTTAEAAVRRLTQSDYDYGLMMNRQRYQSGQPPYMIVREVSGPFDGYEFTLAAFSQLSTDSKKKALAPIKTYARDLIKKAAGLRRSYRISL